jgi:hypothetical protein
MVKIASILARGLTFAAFSFSTPFPVRRHLECLQLASFRCATSAASAFIATLGRLPSEWRTVRLHRACGRSASCCRRTTRRLSLRY